MSQVKIFARQNLIVVCVILAAGCVLSVFAMHMQDLRMHNEFLADVEFSAGGVAWADLEKLKGEASDLSVPAYQNLKQSMIRIVSSHPRYRFAYLLGQRADKSVFFMVDSELAESHAYSPPGQLYPEASASLLRAFADGKPMVEGPVSDRWGTWVSGCVPLKDPLTGTVYAVFGIDVNARQWLWDKLIGGLFPIFFSLFCVALFVISLFIRETKRINIQLSNSDAALKESENKYELFVKNSLEGICFVDKTSRINFVNSRMAHMLGYEIQEMTGKQMDFFMPIEDAADHHKQVTVRAQGLSGQYERNLICKDGSKICVLVSAVPINDHHGAFLGSFGLLVDITERKRVETALQASRERYRLFIDATDDMVFLKDAKLRYVIVNKANQLFFGKTEKEIIGKTDAELMPEQAARHCRESDKAALSAPGVVVMFEQVGEKKYEVHKFSVCLEDGSIGVGGVIRDVTARG